ncbi:MAG: hypothetical protein ACLVIY_03195 [Anaerobutyricum soehngenii]
MTQLLSRAKAYQEGKTVDDNLKTAPVASKRKDAIHKGIEFSLRLLVAVILIILIMHLIHRHELESRRKDQFSRRGRRNDSGLQQERETLSH